MKRVASLKSWSCMFSVMVLSLAIALPALAQPPAPAAAPAAVPAPPPELQQLAFFAGDWTCKGKAEASPMGPAHPTQGTVHIAREIGGFWYVGRYEEKKGAGNPHPMVFQFLQGYDGTAKAFDMACFDSFGGHCHQTSPGWKDGKLVYTGESSGSGPATPVRDTFTKTGEASLDHAGEIQVEGKWVFTDHESCTKAKK